MNQRHITLNFFLSEHFTTNNGGVGGVTGRGGTGNYGVGGSRQLAAFEPDPDLDYTSPINQPQGADLGVISNQPPGRAGYEHNPPPDYKEVSLAVDPTTSVVGNEDDTIPDTLDTVRPGGRWAGPHPDIEQLIGVWERKMFEKAPPGWSEKKMRRLKQHLKAQGKNDEGLAFALAWRSYNKNKKTK